MNWGQGDTIQPITGIKCKVKGLNKLVRAQGKGPLRVPSQKFIV